MVYARVSKTRGCNDLESSSLSPGTMVKDAVERQYEFKVGKTPVLKMATPEAQSRIHETQRKILAAQGELDAALRIRYEAARKLSQDKIKMELWQKLKKGGQALMPDHEALLGLAQKILAGSLRLGPNGWVESAEKPKQNEQ